LKSALTSYGSLTYALRPGLHRPGDVFSKSPPSRWFPEPAARTLFAYGMDKYPRAKQGLSSKILIENTHHAWCII
jgi:hypothetical protein